MNDKITQTMVTTVTIAMSEKERTFLIDLCYNTLEHERQHSTPSPSTRAAFLRRVYNLITPPAEGPSPVSAHGRKSTPN